MACAYLAHDSLLLTDIKILIECAASGRGGWYSPSAERETGWKDGDLNANRLLLSLPSFLKQLAWKLT